MIETKVPKDIRVYETKLIGPFTARQFVCLVITGVFDVFAYSVVFKPLNLSSDFLIYAVLFVDLPLIAFGWVKPMGIPLERYLKMLIVTNFLSPRKRTAKNKIAMINVAQVMSKKQLKIHNKKVKRVLKKNPKYKPIK